MNLLQKKGRGRPRKSTYTAPNVSIAAEFSSSVTSAAATTSTAPIAVASIGRGRGGSNATSAAPNATSVAASRANASTATLNRGMEKGVENTKPFKRPKVMGMGVFQAENGFKTLNPGMPSSRIVATLSTRIESNGPAMIIRSADVTGDIGFKPSSGLKWKGKPAITTRRLQEIRGKYRIQTRTGGSNNLSQNSSSAHPQ
uniref:Uncharacterized protein n=1 Tax=Nicotiana tabacum TaxID=4097 RepID=A0A1S4D1W8_TOBAC|nr:PREDICTED: uncharacterized protein LOC107825112 [Nicotiana tabacum]